MIKNFLCKMFGLLYFASSLCFAETLYLDANTFSVSGNGWKPNQTGYIARQATWMKVLHGADGEFDSTASKEFEIKKPGTYKIWVRYLQSYYYRGPFHISIFSGENKIAGYDFDIQRKGEYVDIDYVWDGFDVHLDQGTYKIVISKIDKNARYYFYTRAIDCILITDGLNEQPDNSPFGPQLYVRIEFGSGHEKPFYVHIFGNYYRAPWYGHFALSNSGLEQTLQPSQGEKVFFKSNQKTPWLNITKLMYFDSGVNLTLSARYSYYDIAPRLNATFYFAYAPDEKAIVKIIRRDVMGSMRIIIPPDFKEQENAEKFTTDLELAEKYGTIADAAKWPEIGRKPQIFPFFVSANIPTVNQEYPAIAKIDQKTFDREWKTLDYFGFSNKEKIILSSNVWNAGLRKDYLCYCGVNVSEVENTAKVEAEQFKKQGKNPEKISYCMTMDEPGGLSVEHLLKCQICTQKFRQYLQEMKLIPENFGVNNWDLVNPVDSTQKDTQPEIFYYTQKFRTFALSKLLRLQRESLENAYGTKFPVNVNFSDGVVYIANFGCIGVDYFDLLDSDDNNSIWSEDWANGSSTRQCTAYNSEIMRSAAMKNNQVPGHYLIGYAGRSPWTMKTYTASHVARDNKILNAYWYGPIWSAHEAGPPWNNHSIQARTDMWYSLAEIIREIGASEDLLYPAKKRKSQVAICYCSSSDIWEIGENYAYGFERMHTWLALAHNQIPVDFLSEKMIEQGNLSQYKVAYLSGTCISENSAEQIKRWVQKGGTLVLTANAALKNQFNRPLTVFDEMLPVKRISSFEISKFLNSGRYLDSLKVEDIVTTNTGARLDVISVKQKMVVKPKSMVLGTFSDSSPAVVYGRYGKGSVYCEGFLPAIAYIRNALIERNRVMEKIQDVNALPEPEPYEVVSDDLLIKRAFEPWKYPAEYRDFICLPMVNAKLDMPVKCSVPLVDAVIMDSKKGSVLVLSNYTFQPIKDVLLDVKVNQRVLRVESVHSGQLTFRKSGFNRISFSVPLIETDFIKIYYR